MAKRLAERNEEKGADNRDGMKEIVSDEVDG